MPCVFYSLFCLSSHHICNKYKKKRFSLYVAVFSTIFNNILARGIDATYAKKIIRPEYTSVNQQLLKNERYKKKTFKTNWFIIHRFVGDHQFFKTNFFCGVKIHNLFCIMEWKKRMFTGIYAYDVCSIFETRTLCIFTAFKKKMFVQTIRCLLYVPILLSIFI